MALAFDSTHRLDPDLVKAKGGVAVIRYLQTGDRPSWKSATKAEVDEYLAAGLGVGVVWEVNTTRALQGYATGYADARRANDAADALGLPNTLTIAWTVDTDVSGYRQVADYDRGWVAGSQGRRPSAPYGEFSVIEGSVAAGRSRTGWQTNARGWSGYKVSPHASIIQGLPSTSPIPNTDPNNVLDLNTPLIFWPNRPVHPGKPPAPFSPHVYPGRVLKVGDRGPDVAALKIMLAGNLGYRGFAMKGDGVNVFTPGTKWAVARYQRRHKLSPVTGQAGPRTWESIRQSVIAKHNAARK